ncbi:MAG: tRNA (adenosine(37)-N6)-threonylcarbamoyltransferase complex ATPase subunit type 1 TsaE [Verrucomicrobia bacterium]|nr:MAG: tRNA (adenosine(37)-N6)-threonylcarbamoyltransferase complex ATPase subunit type 1 TsaE [Verrucomicrobiota bacterium]TAE88452.1 MAG: tRNA (adenosine(37)-N6)-threonylcarbamoyltransferase complex ATPase subunit type 1 TsaE [Verrucomicrobiota bacterium]TAF26907.1 MAG: tRNA (adenosine(37)-N6)-threonylcarbamoyltransferase complex ATPase subunit type 1 TsaE [Verrucomicrobiota bacterium]TAF42163.1 MAG: tRNA (adenosine(37)-N6)-threonylcarbamoyltransferase complex ATPase subunit type 1 TsaE [Verr
MDQVLRDEREMEALGETLGAKLRPGMVLALVGGLGAGKTRLAKGVARGAGYPGEVTSPTFSLVHEYRGGRLPLFHFDLYRLKSADELLSIGWDEFFDEPGVLIVEWADLFPELLPPTTYWLRFEVLPEGGRRLSGDLLLG